MFVCGLWLFLLLFHVSRALCNGAIHEASGQCFEFFTEPRNFTAAQLFCAARGGGMPSVSNAAINDFLQDAGKKFLSKGMTNFWLGAQRWNSEWNWLDGKIPFVYKNFDLVAGPPLRLDSDRRRKREIVAENYDTDYDDLEAEKVLGEALTMSLTTGKWSPRYGVNHLPFACASVRKRKGERKEEPSVDVGSASCPDGYTYQKDDTDCLGKCLKIIYLPCDDLDNACQKTLINKYRIVYRGEDIKFVPRSTLGRATRGGRLGQGRKRPIIRDNSSKPRPKSSTGPNTGTRTGPQMCYLCSRPAPSRSSRTTG